MPKGARENICHAVLHACRLSQASDSDRTLGVLVSAAVPVIEVACASVVMTMRHTCVHALTNVRRYEASLAILRRQAHVCACVRTHRPSG